METFGTVIGILSGVAIAIWIVASLVGIDRESRTRPITGKVWQYVNGELVSVTRVYSEAGSYTIYWHSAPPRTEADYKVPGWVRSF